MYYKEEHGEMDHGMTGCCGHHIDHWPKKMKKQFKLAMLKKKEKMLLAKLDFVREMMTMVEKMPEEEKEKK